MGPDGKLGHIDLLQHVIDTGNAKPVKQPPRRVPIAQREIIEKELGKMLSFVSSILFLSNSFESTGTTSSTI
jgi:hypothetical protein